MSSDNFAVMAWKTCLLVMFIHITLTNSQDELEATQAPSLWTQITRRSVSSWTTGETQNARKWEASSTEQNVKYSDDGKVMADMITEGTLTKDGETTTWADEGASSITWAENSVTETAPGGSSWSQHGSSSCYLFSFIVLGPMSVVISLLGVVFNAMCILVFWPDRSKSANTLLLLQLAVVDTLVLIVWSVADMYFAMTFYMQSPPSHVYNAYPYISKYGWAIANMIHLVSCWLIVYITIQRYVAVCHPHKMRLLGSVRVAWIQLAVLVAVSILFSSIRFFEKDIIVQNGQVWAKKTKLGQNAAFQLYYKGIAYLLIHFIIPLALIVFLTAALIWKFRQQKMKVKTGTKPAQTSTGTGNASDAKGNKEKSNKDKGSKEKSDDVTFALIMVDIIFISCQLITPIYRVLGVLLPPEKKTCGPFFSYLEPLTSWGVLINSSVNFIIFCLCGKGFRSLVFERLGWKSSSVQPGPSSSAPSHAPSQWGGRKK